MILFILLNGINNFKTVKEAIGAEPTVLPYTTKSSSGNGVVHECGRKTMCLYDLDSRYTDLA